MIAIDIIQSIQYVAKYCNVLFEQINYRLMEWISRNIDVCDTRLMKKCKFGLMDCDKMMLATFVTLLLHDIDSS